MPWTADADGRAPHGGGAVRWLGRLHRLSPVLRRRLDSATLGRVWRLVRGTVPGAAATHPPDHGGDGDRGGALFDRLPDRVRSSALAAIRHAAAHHVGRPP